jgi:hypothetical protein
MFRIDLTGQESGRLTVVSFAGMVSNGSKTQQSAWNCQCSCGNTTIVSTRHFSKGLTKSCGCLRGEWARSNTADLLGQTFGRLTVGKYKGRSRWLCNCVCGGTITARTERLRAGTSLSCGCLAREKICASHERSRERRHAAVVGKIINGRQCEACVGRTKGKYQHYRFTCVDCGTVATSTLPAVRRHECRCHQRSTPEQKILALVCRRIRGRFYGFLKLRNIKKTGRTFERLGYTAEQARSHIESKFLPGMTWENRRKWHIDHDIALSTAETEEEIIKLFALENLQPMWGSDNMSKGCRTTTEWQAWKQKAGTSNDQMCYAPGP